MLLYSRFPTIVIIRTDVRFILHEYLFPKIKEMNYKYPVSDRDEDGGASGSASGSSRCPLDPAKDMFIMMEGAKQKVCKRNISS